MGSTGWAISLLLLLPLVTANPDCQCAIDYDEDFRPCSDRKFSNVQADFQLRVKNFATIEAIDPVAHCWKLYSVLGPSKVSLYLVDSSYSKLMVDPKLHSLYVVNTSIAEFAVDESKEYRLERITAENVQLDGFPKNINKFRNLKFIVVDRMSTLDMSQLSGLTSLRSITVNGGCTSWVIGSVDLPGVDLITLDNNELEKIPNDVAKLKSLQYLYLRSNKITQLDMSIFNGLKHLEQLYLGRNPLKVINSYATINLPALQTLDLQYGQLDQLDVANWEMPKLELLNLNGNNLSFVTGLGDRLPRVVLSGKGNQWNSAWLNEVKKSKRIRI